MRLTHKKIYSFFPPVIKTFDHWMARRTNEHLHCDGSGAESSKLKRLIVSLSVVLNLSLHLALNEFVSSCSCWLKNDIAFYVGVVAYFILIFGLCLLIFIIVMVQLARIKRQNPQNQSPNRGVMTDLRSIAGLIILLGLTWGFALFAWGPLYLPFVYLFSIFNSLQGETHETPPFLENILLHSQTIILIKLTCVYPYYPNHNAWLCP